MSHFFYCKYACRFARLEVEAQGQFDDLDLIYCGVGKVNAAYRLYHPALRNGAVKHAAPPELVLNLGSSGSARISTQETSSICTSTLSRGISTLPPSVAPRSPRLTKTSPFLWLTAFASDAYPEGICGTGDDFVTSGAKTVWNVVDMEAYALAKVCFFEKIPFACLKYITDGADGHAASSWEAGLGHTAKALHKAVMSSAG